jgi:hypothetical protein
MQRGVTVWRASGFLGMSAEVPLGNLWPPSSRLQTNAITSRHRVSAVEPAADLEDIRENGQNAREMTWSEWQDLNLRPLRPERSALPG